MRPGIDAKHLIAAAFQTLLNEKHLYQSLEIDFDDAVDERALQMHAAQGLGGHASKADIKTNLLAHILRSRWTLDWPGIGHIQRPGEKVDSIHFELRPVKTMCGQCHSIESFNPSNGALTASFDMSPFEQVFCMPLQCQACRSNVIVFLVRRDRSKIQLVGRSEFEEVAAPASIPKGQKKLYSDAVVAFNSGQVLPALFLLRCVIEQYMRQTTKKTEKLRGEELCDKYAETLSEDFKQRFPSFKEIYSKISDALHTFDSNAPLFESQLEQAMLHFDGLALFARTRR